MYQDKGSKVGARLGAWIDRNVPVVKRVWKAFDMLSDFMKVVTGGVAFAALLFGGNAAVDQLASPASACPSGWAYNEAIEGDAVRRTCYDADTGWSVLLAPDGKTCESGLNTRDRNATPVDCSAIPGW